MKKIFMIAPNFYGIDKSIRNILESFGYEVILKNTRNKLEPVEALALKIAKGVPFTEWMLTPFLKSFLDKDNKEYLGMIDDIKPDIFFTIKGETIYPETLKRIKDRYKIPCVAYMWDCPFYSYTGQFADTFRKNNFSRGMGLYDHIFSHDPYYVRQIQEMGVRQVSYLPLATDPAQYHGIKVSEEERELYDYDICFVGSPFPNRIDILNSLQGFKLGVFGDGWDTWHRLRLKKLPEYYKGKATGEKVLKLYESSKIVLNIHGPEAKEGVNTRTFDILACGAFELVDHKPELGQLLKLGEEIVSYHDIPDLVRLVQYYLDNPQERISIAERGMEKVLASHTWHNRIAEIVAFLKKYIPLPR